MRDNSCSLSVRMTEEQYQRLCRYLAITRLPVTTYFRKLIKETTIHARMPRQKIDPHPAVNHIYSNIRQIARCPRPENSPRSRSRSWSFCRTHFVRSASSSLPSNSPCKATESPMWPRSPPGREVGHRGEMWRFRPTFGSVPEKERFDNVVEPFWT